MKTATGCPHKSSCPLFPLFTLTSNLHLWQDRYCDGAFATCERFRLSNAGQEVPETMLPNGALLRRAGYNRGSSSKIGSNGR